MSCEATMTRLIELPSWRFAEVRHLSDCSACREVATAVEHGERVLSDDIEAFVEGGDFDAVFAMALQEEPVEVAPAPAGWGSIHGFVIALAAAAVLIVAGTDGAFWSEPVPEPEVPEVVAEPTDTDDEAEPEPEVYGPDPVEASDSEPVRAKPMEERPVLVPVVEPAGEDAVVAEEPIVERSEEEVEVMTSGCDILDLEIRARMGQLTRFETACLEWRLESAKRQTEAEKLSLLLLADATGKRDYEEWMVLADRHLDRYGFDADLALIYARRLLAAGRFNEAIRWADDALEERAHWQGFHHVQRVNQCHRIKVAALHRLWLKAEDATTWDPLPSTKIEANQRRIQVKSAAREWYEYAESADVDSTEALQICASAAGSRDLCRTEDDDQ